MAKSFVLILSYASNLQQESINSSCLARDKQVNKPVAKYLSREKEQES